IDGKVLITSQCRNAHDRIPSSFHVKASARRSSSKLPVELSEVHAQAVDKHRLDLLALVEQDRRGDLHGSVHRKKSVGDDFKTGSGLRDDVRWPACNDPGKFHLREGGNLGQSTECEGQYVGV